MAITKKSLISSSPASKSTTKSPAKVADAAAATKLNTASRLTSAKMVNAKMVNAKMVNAKMVNAKMVNAKMVERQAGECQDGQRDEVPITSGPIDVSLRHAPQVDLLRWRTRQVALVFSFDPI